MITSLKTTRKSFSLFVPSQWTFSSLSRLVIRLPRSYLIAALGFIFGGGREGRKKKTRNLDENYGQEGVFRQFVLCHCQLVKFVAWRWISQFRWNSNLMKNITLTVKWFVRFGKLIYFAVEYYEWAFKLKLRVPTMRFNLEQLAGVN